jgi:hypothetical protein
MGHHSATNFNGYTTTFYPFSSFRKLNIFIYKSLNYVIVTRKILCLNFINQFAPPLSLVRV